MRGWLVMGCLVGGLLAGEPPKGIGLEPAAAGRLAGLVLACAEKEYPNKLDHVMNDAAEVRSPQALHPAFYGCFDWHSSVHGHWLMVRLLKQFPEGAQAEALRRVLNAHLAPGPLAVERAYLDGPNRAGFERTYGWAWLLKLAAELRTWDNPDARRWSEALEPFAQAIRSRMMAFLAKATYPIRTGVHPNTAFTLNLALDEALAAKDAAFEAFIRNRARSYFLKDRGAPMAWEPGAEDFLSPVLEEAALMARVLPPAEFRRWFAGFLPNGLGALEPAVVSDRSDPKIVHLDGLNLSRARCLYRLRDVATTPEGRNQLRRLADRHLQASLPYVASGSYEGEHWLGTFALLALEAQAGR